jgi:hypothetical protein
MKNVIIIRKIIFLIKFLFKKYPLKGKYIIMTNLIQFCNNLESYPTYKAPFSISLEIFSKIFN